MKTAKTLVTSVTAALALSLVPANGIQAKAAPEAAFALAAGSQTAQNQQDKTQPQPAVQTDKKQDRAAALKKFLEGQNFETAGNFPAAVSAYKEAITLDPQSAELRVALGSLYLKNRNVIDAEAQAREAIKTQPDGLDGRKLLARIYIAQSFVGNSFDKEKARAALVELEAISKKDPAAKIDLGDQPIPVLALVGDLYWSLEDKDKAIDAYKRVSEVDAKSDPAHFQLAQMYFQKNKFREAAVAARKAYDINPKSARYAGLLAKSLLRLGRTQEALDIYKKALNVKDSDPKGKPENKGADDDDDDANSLGLPFNALTFDYAEALVFAGKYDEAIKQIDPVLKLARKDSPLYLGAIRIKVDALRRQNKREDAVSTLEEALKGQDVSESLPVLYSLAETYEEMQNFDKAVATYEEALGAIVNPDGTVGSDEDRQNAGAVLTRMGLAYRTAGKRDKALETFERMRKVLGADSTQADRLILDTLINEGKNKEALEAATKASERFPDERTFKIVRAQAAGRLGDTPAVEAALKPLLKNTSEDADIYLAWSSIQLEANQLKQAEESARKAASLEPNDIAPLISLSLIQERQDKFKEAEATLRKALEIDPENPTVLNNLGYYLAERGERLPEAADLIQRAVNIEPTNGSFMDSLGWVLFRQGKIQEAQKYLEQAVIYSPRSSAIHDHLGDLYKKQGQADKARQQWEEALKLATEPDEIKKIKEKLGKK